ncbi:hypothetical protein EIN_225850 [Entamoeba invadens IP1]|uniref:Telomere length regulation protein conserved domain-containing protein n=1 Tax=Entamoeba invadens IP1 TaxID=370355 RepID=A0A0A1U2F2_ENTIV|nr:hypothetical protein EIN_225850 [Entamoeba invadens IP1]ELP88242.1 hypothetical protein EIN_225850 [Entamoeba invadens IP1]|eukprot:XP_004255013.1 hypothetical protein EIN_225850 [Entamoeba invadens IP1]
MSLLWEEKVEKEGSSVIEKIQDVNFDRAEALNELKKVDILHQFTIVSSLVENMKGLQSDVVSRISFVVQKFFEEKGCVEVILSKTHQSVVRRMMKVAMLISNRVMEGNNEFFEDRTFCSYLVYKIVKGKTVIGEEKFIKGLAEFNSIETIRGGLEKLLKENVDDSFVDSLLIWIKNSGTRRGVDIIGVLINTLKGNEKKLCYVLDGISLKEIGVDSTLFFETIKYNKLSINDTILKYLVVKLSQSPKANDIIHSIFALYSNTQYISVSSRATQKVLTHYIVYILRCSPFRVGSYLLVKGVSYRIESGIEKMRKEGSVVIREIDFFNKAQRKVFTHNIDDTIEDFDVATVDERENDVDTLMKEVAPEDGSDDVEDIVSSVQELKHNESEVLKDTEHGSKPKEPQQKMQLLYWMDLLSDYTNLKYEDFAHLLKIGSMVINDSSKYNSVYLEQIARDVLLLKNRFNFDFFCDSQIDILSSIVHMKTIPPKRGIQVLLDQIELDREIVIKTMIKNGYNEEWILPLRNYMAVWVYENRYEYAIHLSIQYLKDYSTIEVLREWILLYMNCRINQRVGAGLLTGTIQIIALNKPSLVVATCYDLFDKLAQQLHDDEVNHPFKELRIAASTLLRQLVDVVTKAKSTEKESTLLL